MRLDIATLEGFLVAEKNIRELIPPTATENCDTIRERVSKMTDTQAADLCRWIRGLSDAARVLRSLQFELPTV